MPQQFDSTANSTPREHVLNDPSSPIQTVLDTAVDGIISIDVDGNILLFNRAAEQMFGYQASEVIGRNVKMLMPAPYQEEHDQYLQNYLTTGSKKIIGIGREAIARRKDGSLFPIDLAVGEAQGATRYRFVGFIRDISEKKRLETRSLRAQRLESIGTLAGGIAHDLNNVLTPILMAIRLLRKPLNVADREELLTTALASVERGTSLIKQLLSFAGGGDTAKAPCNLREIIAEVHSLLEHTVPKSIAIHVNVADDLWTVSGDMTQLSQILMNLCVNARDAMSTGGTLTIAAVNISARQSIPCLPNDLSPGRYVRLSVSDSGSGIPPEVFDKIFDPFFTTKEFGRGTGLGLSTVLGIVRSHGGGINVYSEVGSGTRITVYIPALMRESETAGQAERDQPQPGHGQLILIVDDEAPIRITAAQVLKSAGYEVLTAADGAEALKIYQQRGSAIDAVILDMMMPVMDGTATMQELSKLNAEARVITASGLRPAEREAQFGALRPRAFLQKPYSDDELLKTLGDVLKD